MSDKSNPTSLDAIRARLEVAESAADLPRVAQATLIRDCKTLLARVAELERWRDLWGQFGNEAGFALVAAHVESDCCDECEEWMLSDPDSDKGQVRLCGQCANRSES